MSFLGAFSGVLFCYILEHVFTYIKIKRQVYRISNRNEKKIEEFFERC